MKKEIFNEVEIPEGIEARVEGNAVLIKGQLGEIKREFNTTNVKIEMMQKSNKKRKKSYKYYYSTCKKYDKRCPRKI